MSEKLCCPTCGADMGEPRLTVDLINNVVLGKGGLRWRLRPKLAEFLFVLNSAWPHAVSEHNLMIKLWGANNENSAKALGVYASNLRTMLAPLNIDIASRQHAYRLIFLDAQPDKREIPSWRHRKRSTA